MISGIRLGVFIFVTAMAVILLSDTANGMAFFEEGSGQKTFPSSRKINPSTVPKPKKKTRPVVKKQAPKKVVSAPAPKPKAPKYTPFKTDELVKRTVVGGTSTAVAVAIPAIPTGELAVIPSAAGGAATGAITYIVEWGYDNAGYGCKKVVNGYKKASILEDPMGETFPH